MMMMMMMVMMIMMMMVMMMKRPYLSVFPQNEYLSPLTFPTQLPEIALIVSYYLNCTGIL